MFDMRRMHQVYFGMGVSSALWSLAQEEHIKRFMMLDLRKMHQTLFDAYKNKRGYIEYVLILNLRMMHQIFFDA